MSFDPHKSPNEEPETVVPSIPAITPDNVQDVLKAIKQIVEVREGIRGSGYDQNITWRDVFNAGVVDFDIPTTGVVTRTSNIQRVIPKGGGAAADPTDHDLYMVNTIDDLRNLSPTVYTRVLVLGYYAVGDGGGGIYYYDAADTSSADNGGSIIIDAVSSIARWKLTDTGTWSAKQFGAKGDGSTSDIVAIRKFLVARHAAGGGTAYFPEGVYIFPSKLSPNLTATNWVKIQGAGSGATIFKSTAGAGVVPFGDAYFFAFESTYVQIEICDITFDTGNTPSTATNTCVMGFSNGSAPYIHDCWFVGRSSRLGIIFGNISYGRIERNFITRTYPSVPIQAITAYTNDAGRMRVAVSLMTGLTLGRRVIIQGVNATCRGKYVIDDPTAGDFRLRVPNTSPICGAISGGSGRVRLYVNSAAMTQMAAYAPSAGSTYDRLYISYLTGVTSVAAGGDGYLVQAGTLLANVKAAGSITFVGAGAFIDGINTVRLTYAAPHGYSDDMGIEVSGATFANGNWCVRVVSANVVDLRYCDIGASAPYAPGAAYSATYELELAGTTFVGAWTFGGLCEYSQPSIFGGAYGGTGGTVTVANEYQTQAFLGFGTNSWTTINNNIFLGWGLICTGSNYRIQHNVIQNFEYGSGIAMTADSDTYRVQIHGNIITGGFGIDVNITQPSGIECWCPLASIQGNIVFDNANGGIMVGGSDSIVTGNHSFNNGNFNSTGVGICLISQAGSTNAARSLIFGNTVYDSGIGYQKYGYYEYNENAGVHNPNYYGITGTNIRVFDNHIYGSLTADYTMSNAATQKQFRGYVYETLNVATGVTGVIAIGQQAFVVAAVVGGAVVGDYVDVMSTNGAAELAGWKFNAVVNAPNAVNIYIINQTAAPAAAPAYAVNIRVHQRRP